MKKSIFLGIFLFLAVNLFSQNFYETKLIIPHSDQNSQFGKLVSIFGDYALIGGVNNAYLFNNDGSNWNLIKSLKIPPGKYGKQQLVSLAISRNDIILYLREQVQLDFISCGAYLFSRNKGGSNQWGFVKKLIDLDVYQNAVTHNNLKLVSIFENYALIGNPGDNSQGTNSGSVYIFRKNKSGDWKQLKKLIAPDAKKFDNFGSAVSIYRNNILIGAFGSSPNEIDKFQGAAYLFSQNREKRSNWRFIKKLIAPDGKQADMFGLCVSISKNYAFVGNSRQQEYPIPPGAIYTYYINQGGRNNWGFIKKVSDIKGAKLSGLNIFSFKNLVIASSYLGESIYLSLSDWSKTKKLNATPSKKNNSFGYSLAFAQKYLLVGAPGTDSDKENTGAAYIYSTKPSSPPKRTKTYTTPISLAKESDAKNPIIFIPGIMASPLYNNSDKNSCLDVNEKIWVNEKKIASTFGRLLKKLNVSGRYNIIPAPIRGDKNNTLLTNLDELPLSSYKEFFQYFNKNGYPVDNTELRVPLEQTKLFCFTYDWRKGISENSKELKKYMDKVIYWTKAKQVNIVAHSMGGLIAKSFIKNNGSEKIENLFFIGTPHLGAPKIYYVLLTGDLELGFLGDLIIHNKTLMDVSKDMYSPYQLFPTKKYFETNIFTPKIKGYNHSLSIFYYGVKGLDSTKYFGYNGAQTIFKKLKKGGVPLYNTRLIAKSNKLQKNLSEIDFGKINVYNIVGVGIPTIGQVGIKCFKKTRYAHDPLYNLNGDGTVPLKSSIQINGRIIKNTFYIEGVEHSELASNKKTIKIINSILNKIKLGANYSFKRYSYLNKNIYQVVVSCPVIVQAYDEKGNHTGPISFKKYEENIPGSHYIKANLNDEHSKKIFLLPDDKSYRFYINPQSNLSFFDFTLYHWGNGKIKSLANFRNIKLGSKKRAIVKIDAIKDSVQLIVYSKIDNSIQHIYSLSLPKLNNQHKAIQKIEEYFSDPLFGAILVLFLFIFISIILGRKIFHPFFTISSILVLLTLVGQYAPIQYQKIFGPVAFSFPPIIVFFVIGFLLSISLFLKRYLKLNILRKKLEEQQKFLEAELKRKESYKKEVLAEKKAKLDTELIQKEAEMKKMLEQKKEQEELAELRRINNELDEDLSKI